MKKWILPLVLLAGKAHAQQSGTWTLEACIDQALKNNLDIRISEVTASQNENNFHQSHLNLTPDANINAGQFFQSGRSIDRFTNQFVQTTVRSNNFQLQSSAVLFAGGSIQHNISSNRCAWQASEFDVKNMEQNVALNVANLFLQAVQARELVASASRILENTKAQLERTEKLYAAGAANEGQVLNLKAQMANDEVTLTNAKNQHALALANLKMTLRIPAAEEFGIIIPALTDYKPEVYPAGEQELYDSAMQRRPDVKAADMRLKASEFAKKAARGALMPTLSVGGNLSTVYSSNAKSIGSTSISGFQPIGRVQGSGDIVEAPQITYTLQTIDFSKQLKDNFGQSLGFNLSIPVYGKLQNRTSMENARLEEERARLSAERTRQSLYNEVVGAYNNFLSALQRYRAAIQAQEAQQLNMDFVQKRFDAGLSNVYELQLARTNEATARLNLTSVRYEYIFRRMVLDFYLGKPLKL